MTASQEIQTTGSKEHAESQETFWGSTVDILQEHNTEVLKGKVKSIAPQTIGYDEEQFDAVLATIEKKYAQKGERKFVPEPEVNHAYQVTLLTILFLNPQNLHHDTFITALAHDLDEDTSMTNQQITQLTSERIYRGIDALSHQSNHKPIYPDAEDKGQYFSDLLKAHNTDPSLGLLAIKVMDQIAVSNGPLTAEELKKKPGIKEKWEETSKDKLGEMTLLRSMIASQMIFHEKRIAKVLDQAISFVELRLDPKFGPQFAKGLNDSRRRRQNVEAKKV